MMARLGRSGRQSRHWASGTNSDPALEETQLFGLKMENMTPSRQNLCVWPEGQEYSRKGT